MKKVLLIAAVALCAMSCCNNKKCSQGEGTCCDSAAVSCEAAAPCCADSAAACGEAAATDTVVVEEVVETVAE